MTKTFTVAVVLWSACMLAADPAMAQRRRGGGGGGGGTVSSGGSGGSGGGAGRAVPRGATRGGDEGRGGSGADRSSAPPSRAAEPSDGDAKGDSGSGRSRNGEATARRAVPRGSVPGGGRTIIVDRGGYYGGFYPWGYAGLGFGGYYSGFYDPWWYGGGYAAGYGSDYEGALRIKVKPREADVFVDGYFAGQVDDFDGVFQRLKVDPGPHRIEIREEGYEPLMFEVRIQPDRTVTYKGELERAPAP